MAAEEYEIETIMKAKAFKRGKKMDWKYYVKWKGYDDESDNTWEPSHSFQGSADEIINIFWQRVDLGERDRTDVNAFKSGEEVLPKGPPRRGRPSFGRSAASSSAKQPEVTETKNIGKKRGRPSTLTEPDSPVKRGRTSRTARESTTPERIPSPAPDSTDDEIRLVPTPKRSKTASKNGVASRRAAPATQDVEMLEEVPDSTEELILPAPGLASEEDVGTPEPPSLPARLPAPDLLAASRTPARRARGALKKATDKPTPTSARSTRSSRSKKVQVLDTTEVIEITDDSDEDAPGPSGSKESPPSVTRRVSGSKAGPGRSSRGMKPRNASLLSFNKGKLTTLARQPQKAEAEEALEVAEHLASEGSRIDSTTFNTVSGSNGTSTNVEITMAVDPPKPQPGEELMLLVALKEAEAGPLPDFDDTDAEGEPESPVQEQAPLRAGPELPAVMPTSVKFPEAKSKDTGKAWSSTIFGPLTLGFKTSFTSPQLPASEPSTSQAASPCLFSLSSSTALPVALKDVTSASTLPLSQLSNILKPGPKGPPGALYKGEAATALLDALETGGSAARLVLHDTADSKQGSSFSALRSQLDAGGLFIVMAGAEIVASCSATNQAFVEKLKVPAQLRGLGETVIVSHVRVVNGNAYANAAGQAEKSPGW
ncbi:hypothetical protein FA95DRAFT_1568406 [Auriscalpium vulgare]|uniref:Uncharacterized protein n=1 Tax=Auriscalpium vulgare TaxID=40419 RepID=A0ACB8SE90_9AGAM|nr:hypothetical protein FA95DRAFT_1568406 [Auriscalpium vulgare]